ncbi:MAG TPA: alpha/beta hydrolase [Chthoniobacteraceae bacterium]|nr:alpha/beta hydrolase [Chthoniobacteraceae bacterium]
MNNPTPEAGVQPGDFVHRFVPGQAVESAPVLLLLHGTGGSEDDLLGLGHLLAPGASLLAPRGKVLENGMPRFFRRLSEGVFDHDDLVRRSHELAAWVRVAARAYRFDVRNVIAVGYSNGANIAASLLLLAPGLLRGAVLFRAMLPFLPETPPDLAGTAVYLAAGKHDPLVPVQQVEALAGLLEQSKAEVTLRWSENGHRLTPEEPEAARRWLDELKRIAKA